MTLLQPDRSPDLTDFHLTIARTGKQGIASVPYEGHTVDICFSYHGRVPEEQIRSDIQNALERVQALAHAVKLGEPHSTTRIELTGKDQFKFDDRQVGVDQIAPHLLATMRAIASPELDKVTIQFRTAHLPPPQPLQPSKRMARSFKSAGDHFKRARMVGEIQISEKRIHTLLTSEPDDKTVIGRVFQLLDIHRPPLRPLEEVGRELGLQTRELKRLKELYRRYEAEEVGLSDIVNFVQKLHGSGEKKGGSAALIGHMTTFIAETPRMRGKKTLLQEIGAHFIWQQRVLNPIREILSICIFLHLPNPIIQKIAQLEAYLILKRVEQFEGHEAGVMITTGFVKHCVGMEIRKNEGYYDIYAANTGSHCCLHKDKQCLPVQHFRIPSNEKKELTSLLSKLAILNAERAPLRESSKKRSQLAGDEFYAILNQHATSVTNLGIPPRATQAIGNCPFRSPLELIVHRLQDLGEAQVASDFQTYFQEIGREVIRQEPSASPFLKTLAADTRTTLAPVGKKQPPYLILTTTEPDGTTNKTVIPLRPDRDQFDAWIASELIPEQIEDYIRTALESPQLGSGELQSWMGMDGEKFTLGYAQ